MKKSLLVLLALMCIAVFAAENKVERKGPLAKLPSRPGPHIAKIRALRNNQWLNLGAPKPDPKWGAGRGRSWGCKMVYAPDLGGAFHSGQGKHGYVKPDGFYDDIFFYNMYAHQWICLYEGINTKTYAEDIKKGNIRLGRDGYLVHKDGRPVYAWGAHSYQFQAYDTDRHTYICGGWGSAFGGDQHCRNAPWHAQGIKLLAEKAAGNPNVKKPKGLWYAFDATTGKLSRSPLTGMFYLPGKKAFWSYSVGTGRIHLAYPATGKIDVLVPKGTGPLTGGFPDFGACYDSKRDRIYIGQIAYGRKREGAGSIYIYDVKTNTWSNPPDKQNAGGFPATNYGVVNYDTAGDRVIVISHWQGKGGVAAYDPETSVWESLPPPPESFNANRACIHGFYSPEVNAHFFYLAHDSDDRGTMWVYRYKQKKGE